MVGDDAYLNATDSAIRALSDFELDYPITVDIEAAIYDALRDMNRLGIHALLVSRQGLRGVDPQVEGMITAHDIKRAQPYHLSKRGDLPVQRLLRVREVMTPWDELYRVKYQSLRALTAMDAYQVFYGTGLTHLLVANLLVVQVRDDEVTVARGVLSRAALGKRLEQAHPTEGHRSRNAVGPDAVLRVSIT